MRLVIFDCDGTLVDSQAMIVGAMQLAFDEYGLEPLERETVLSIVGLSLFEAVARLLPAASPGRIEEVAQSYKRAFFKLRKSPEHHEPMYDGAHELVRRLAGQDDVVLGIATGKSQRGVAAFIEREGLEGCFVTIQTADDAPSKPHPGMIEQAMAAVGADPALTMMIGDTTYDIEMGHNAGVTPVAVRWGYHRPEELQAVRPARMVGDMAALGLTINEFVAGAWPHD